jgi:hypothetical protein
VFARDALVVDEDGAGAGAADGDRAALGQADDALVTG